jgi:predicted Zn-dependent peptidase
MSSQISHEFKVNSSGLVVATDVMDTIETVTVNVLVKTGSRYETATNNGISHFLEHMAFKGTKTRSAIQIAQEFDMIGGYFNAYTSRERTVYYAKVLKDDVNVAIDILSDILQNSVFDNEEIEKERGVIIQEIAQTQDLPDELIFDHFQETAFPNQPFGMGILGPLENIKAIQRDDIVNYVNDHYSYPNIIVSCAGNINREQFYQTINNKFTNFSTKQPEQFQQAEYKGGDFRIYKDLEQVHVVLGFNAVSYLDNDYYTQQVLSIIAGGGMSSRLFQEVREKRGLAYSISSFVSSYNDNGIFGIYAGVSEEKVNELITVVSDEMKKLILDINEDEIKRAKAQVRASLLMSQESSISRAEKLASNLAVFGRYISITEILERIEEINVNKVQDFAKKLLTQEYKPTLATIGKINNLIEYDQLLAKIKL